MKVLITGGCGYIGSHTAVRLLESGEEVVIIDNLINSKIDVLDKIKEITGKNITFYQEDLCNCHNSNTKEYNSNHNHSNV